MLLIGAQACVIRFADHNVEGLVTEYLGSTLPGVSRSWDAKRWLDHELLDVVLCCDAYCESLAARYYNVEKVLHAIPYNLLRRQRRAES